MDALAFLSSLDLASVVMLFWYTTLLEIPRYTIGALIVPAVMLSVEATKADRYGPLVEHRSRRTQ